MGATRPLMTSLIPSVLRLLKVELRGLKKESYDPPLTPLPEFLPSALFSDLNLPELTLIFPTEEIQTEKMPILQGLRSLRQVKYREDLPSIMRERGIG